MYETNLIHWLVGVILIVVPFFKKLNKDKLHVYEINTSVPNRYLVQQSFTFVAYTLIIHTIFALPSFSVVPGFAYGLSFAITVFAEIKFTSFHFQQT